MALPDEEIRRFKQRKNSDEPVENLLPGEMFEPMLDPQLPDIKNLWVPKSPLTKKKLDEFLLELEPIIEGIQHVRREDQQLIARSIQEVKSLIQASNLPIETKETFDKVSNYFNAFLIHGTPGDQNGVLAAIKKLL